MDPNNFVTRKMRDTMEYIADELHCVMQNNTTLLNTDRVDTSKKFNHCSVMLYYASVNLNEKSSLGFYSNYVYSPINGDFVTSSNSQVENTQVVVYSIDDSRNLHWKRRKIGLSNTGHSKLIDNPSFK